ncbi:acetoacetate decarboxylase [Larsenimonas rhizosphaerae]|uniref:acetoacetate decarboxylase n=1 Tax=Larsenimonas rhizosphaerae TaxID=2944682 RepID=UPI0020336409|nr:acetoacetate decarboxylase [Larsenimonas rhizosphaerae]MCM2131537.1 acetoacetate decarboxylase [Larsenimonas rhizosphaerae]
MKKTPSLPEHSVAMPWDCPSYPPGPYRFVNREFFNITYRTDAQALRRVLPEPLTFDEPLVKFEFINMPDSTGFGQYVESGQVIPCLLEGKAYGYQRAMYLDDHAPIAGGRELWGFPKKLATPRLSIMHDTLTGTLEYAGMPVAQATMGFKHRALDTNRVRQDMLDTPTLLYKLIPHVDGSPRIAELVEVGLEDLVIKGAWEGPGRLQLYEHVFAPVADLPVRDIVSVQHLLTDLTLPYGRVVHDYLA